LLGTQFLLRTAVLMVPHDSDAQKKKKPLVAA
jgi:hypothetical protein